MGCKVSGCFMRDTFVTPELDNQIKQCREALIEIGKTMVSIIKTFKFFQFQDERKQFLQEEQVYLKGLEERCKIIRREEDKRNEEIFRQKISSEISEGDIANQNNNLLVKQQVINNRQEIIVDPQD
ncbi:hypothetical protein OXYTRIMIC_526 [Oxytricha trifallax]|uniref:Uncharacterized protein n=1 Tax=Oxytricha trifallax TaxID=1172189 RepID=A0A073I024_9SPIT|nr:hypothetical protein OXYTRIMIC_526 [Oxytricha trifallax]